MHELSSSRGRRLSAGASKIALSVGLCLCAGQLVATPAQAATVAPVTSAVAVKAAAAKRVIPRMTIAGKRSVNSGSSVKLTSKVVNPRTGKVVNRGTVRLQAWRNGTWRTIQTKKVARNGTVSFVTKQVASVTLRTLFLNTTGYRWTVSRTHRLTVVANGGAKVIAEAKKHKGKAYRFGASGPRNFDCSGYTMYVYKKSVGKKLPHKADAQQRYGKSVAKSNAKAGDLVVVRSGGRGTHAGIYAGGGYMWAAPRTGKTVTKQKIWSRNYVVRRLV